MNNLVLIPNILLCIPLELRIRVSRKMLMFVGRNPYFLYRDQNQLSYSTHRDPVTSCQVSNPDKLLNGRAEISNLISRIRRKN